MIGIQSSIWYGSKEGKAHESFFLQIFLDFSGEFNRLEKTFFAKRGIIGKNLEVRKNIYLTVSAKGIVKNISNNKPSGGITRFSSSLLVPSFINCHTHIGDTFAKEKAYGMTVEATVAPPNSLKHKLLDKTKEKNKIQAIRKTFAELLSNGITCFFDFRERGIHGIKLLQKALKNHRIKAKILGRPDGDMKKILTCGDGLGLSSINKYSDETLQSFLKEASRYSKSLAYHASETLALREKSLELFGETDIVRGIKLLAPNFIVHATYATGNDIQYLKEHDITTVLCPRANGYLGVGMPPIKQLSQANVPLCLGTDNLMLNAPNFFKEFDYLVRIARLQGITLKPKKILEMATVTPSRLLEKPSYLSEESPADFFIFDLEKENVKNISDPLTALILRGSNVNVKATYVNGHQVWPNDR